VKNFDPSALSESGSLAVRAAPVRPITNAQNRQMIRARFDNQFTTEQNRNIWALSDMMSVDASANFMVRRTLRMRARYTYHNNPYFMGTANRLARFVIGRGGPKLHLNTGNPDWDKAVEREFGKWQKAVKYARKLRVSRAARFYNGEGFNLLRTNPKVKHKVKLDVFEIEADQVSSPLFGIFPSQYPDQYFDGVVLDPWGNVETYHVLRQHPGAFGAFLVMGYEFDPWPARYVLHDYARLRPAQQRGIPEATPALDLFEELRGYRKSVQSAARTASDWAGTIETIAPDGGDVTTQPDTGFGTQTDYVDMKRGTLAVLPIGTTMKQMKAEQPTTTFDTFTTQILIEISQVLNDMPLFIISGDARLANMSSAYVVTQGFANAVATDREEYDCLNDQVFDEWLIEASRIPGMIPKDVNVGDPGDIDRTWRWPRMTAHADPEKMANAATTRLKTGTRSPSIECADDGLDFEEVAARAAEDYGVTVAEYKAALFQSTFTARGTIPPATLAPGTGSDNAPDKENDPSTDE
jgi:capsid protein